MQNKSTSLEHDNSVYTADQIPQFNLSWNHYQILTHIKDDARRFYEIEARKQDWSTRQLQRQIGSGLYERLAPVVANAKILFLKQFTTLVE